MIFQTQTARGQVAALSRHQPSTLNHLSRRSPSEADQPLRRLQRKCACGGTPGPTGECEECAKKNKNLQRKIDNQRAQGASRSRSNVAVVQRKLTIGACNDPLEQEADRIADQVMSTPAQSPVSGAPPRIQRFPGHSSGEMNAAPASVDQALASRGAPLDPALRIEMEQRFGHDFSKVRVHTDTAAAQSAREVNAHAYTVGQSVVFDASRFAPRTSHGRRLLAHELTHVVQQAGGEGMTSALVQRQPTRPRRVSTSDQFELLNEIQSEFNRSKPREARLTEAFNALEPNYAALVDQAIVSGKLGTPFQKLSADVGKRLRTLLTQRKATVAVLSPGVYGKGVRRLGEWDYFIVRHGVTIDEIANYLSDDPALPSVIEARNKISHDQVLAAGTLVYFPLESFKRPGARKQLSQDLRSGSFIYPWGAFKVSHTEERTLLRDDVRLTRSEFESIRENELQQKHGADAVKQIAATEEANKAKQLKGDVKRAQKVPNALLSFVFPTSRLYFKDQSSLISNPLLRFQYETNLRGFDAGTNLYREAGAVAVAVNLAPLAILEGSALAGLIPALPATIQGVSTTVWAKTLGAAGLSSSYLGHVVNRSKEAAATEGGSNPISIVSAAILDTSGVGEVSEAAENESLLTGKPLHRSQGERAGGAIKGTLEFALNFFGAKALFDDPVPQVKTPRRAATESPSEPAPSPSPAPVPQVVSPAPTAAPRGTRLPRWMRSLVLSGRMTMQGAADSPIDIRVSSSSVAVKTPWKSGVKVRPTPPTASTAAPGTTTAPTQAPAPASTAARVNTTAPTSVGTTASTPVSTAGLVASASGIPTMPPVDVTQGSAFEAPSGDSIPMSAAFAEDAQYQVGTQKQVGRVRTTGSGHQLMSLDAIQLSHDQRLAARTVHGQQMTGAQQNAWQNATNPREQNELAEINRLWNLGTTQSQQQARELAREVFDRHRNRYWTAVRASPALRATFEAAGMRFTGGNTTAPVYDLPDGTVIRMTLEHSVRLADDPTRSLNGNNLQFVLNDENSVFLEFIRAFDPFQ